MKPRNLLALILLVGGLSIGMAEAIDPSERLSDPALESRARAITAELRCLVCRNESIDESNADLAKDLRKLVREQIVAGQTNQQIIDYIVSRYGDFVRLLPPIKFRTVILWGFPLLILVVMAGILVWRRRQRLRESPSDSAIMPAIAKPESTNSGSRFSWIPLASLSFFCLVAAFGFYLLLGRPDLPEQPLANRQRIETPANLATMTEADRTTMITGMVARLEARLSLDPQDSEGWLRLAQSRLVLGNRAAALQALADGATANPDAVRLQLTYALSLYQPQENGGLPSPRVEAILRHILTIEPNQPESLWLLARLDAHRGDKQRAQRYLDRLLQQLPKDAPVRDEIDKLYKTTE
ncbi:MAG: cytochrome c-type biogenesis protein CcmH [Candidatus Pacebacteria bacterium]|nr:cytochrome c-type biogenesis protein CcmH [Candidatus Paceibacterota bacterium]